METARAVLAAALPFALVAAFLLLLLRARRRRDELPARAPLSPRTRSVVLVLILLLTMVVSGWLGDWTLLSVLMPLGWLAAGAALYWIDRLLDRQVRGHGPKVRGPIPFWWMFVWAGALGWAVPVLSGQESPWPTAVQLAVLVGLVLAAAAAFCVRYGLRPVR